MAKPELGAKRQCQACGAKFFDLNKDPIVCPKCGTVFQGAAAAVRARPAAKEDEEDTEMVAPAGVDIVSLDEVEAERGEGRRDGGRGHRRRGRRRRSRGRFLPRGGGRGRRRRHQPDRRRHRAGRGGVISGVAWGRSTEGDGFATGVAFFMRWALWPTKLCGYTAARARNSALRPKRSAPARDHGNGIMENGAIAQLGERFNGIEEVVGSIPSGSTIPRAADADAP